MFILIVFASMLILWGTYEFAFYLTHRRPLTSNEIQLLAAKRRVKKITEYYCFSKVAVQANRDFKSNMKSSGCLYQINNDLCEMPAIAAALLKGKNMNGC